MGYVRHLRDTAVPEQLGLAEFSLRKLKRREGWPSKPGAGEGGTVMMARSARRSGGTLASRGNRRRRQARETPDHGSENADLSKNKL
jgi:hypothetical protein